MNPIIKRTCLLCGETLSGRTDKKFCSDACRSEYHNRRRRRDARVTAPVNRILARNRRLLIRIVQSDRVVEDYSVLASKGFNYAVYTSRIRRIFRPDIYKCYEFAYSITSDGKVHITPPELFSCASNQAK